jgi:hypothetical protein
MKTGIDDHGTFERPTPHSELMDVVRGIRTRLTILVAWFILVPLVGMLVTVLRQ